MRRVGLEYCAVALCLGLGVTTAGEARAQNESTVQNSAQSSAQGTAQAIGQGAQVARLSLLDGEVHVATSGYGAESLDAAVNMPIAAGESIATGANADSEVEFPDGSVLRSAASSSATLIRLQPQTEIGLDDGLYYLELRAGTDPQFVVYAGDLSIEPKENASFRVRVVNGQPEIAVLRGVINVTRASSYTVDVQRGESLRPDTKDNRRYLLADTIGEEPADRWNERRAQQAADASASQTIAREEYAGDQGYGWSDLDNSGAWYPLPGEGMVWQPYGVDAGFDPYGFGNWVYAGFGGGYVWASGYQWGWLPFHCGSWGFFPGFGWGWQPAAGCRSYGGGWPVRGFPVRHPPQGWRPPQPVRPLAAGGIVVRHPTLPGAPGRGTARQFAGKPREAAPIQWEGLTLRPLSPIAPPPTPHGSSAVGSALRRDFPIQTETHVPLLGRETAGVAAIPGRAPEWHAPSAVASRGEEVSRGESGSAVSTQGVPAEAATAAAAGDSTPVVVVPGATLAGQTFSTGWRNRIPAAPPYGSRPAGAAPVQPAGIRPVPGGAGAVLPPGMRVPDAAPLILVQPARPVPVIPGPPRTVSPPPAAVPHFNPPAAPPPQIRVSPASPAAPPPSSATRPK